MTQILRIKAHDRVPSGARRRVTALNGEVQHLRITFASEGRMDHGNVQIGAAVWVGRSRLKWFGHLARMQISDLNKTGTGYLLVRINLIFVPRTTCI